LQSQHTVIATAGFALAKPTHRNKVLAAKAARFLLQRQVLLQQSHHTLAVGEQQTKLATSRNNETFASLCRGRRYAHNIVLIIRNRYLFSLGTLEPRYTS